MSDPASSSDTKYNTAFERLVTTDDDIEGFIGYGLYKIAKREWLIEFQAKHGRPPSHNEFQAYADVWTPTALQSLRENAESALSAYARAVVAAETPTIAAEALRVGRPIWKDLLIGASAALAYSILLLVAAAILNAFGNDFLDALEYMRERVGG